MKNKSSEPRKKIEIQKMKPEEIDKMDQEFIREMMSQELNRVKVTKGNEDLKRKDPQDKKGTAKLADTGT